MAQKLRAGTVLAEDQSLVPSIHIRQLKVAFNSNPRELGTSFLTPHALYTCAHFLFNSGLFLGSVARDIWKFSTVSFVILIS